MSRTQRANGQKIFDAVHHIVTTGEGVMKGYFTTRMVAEQSGMSKPTAQKYLLIMSDAGNIAGVTIGRGTTLWKWMMEMPA